jgi:hypothetical protein
MKSTYHVMIGNKIYKYNSPPDYDMVLKDYWYLYKKYFDPTEQQLKPLLSFQKPIYDKIIIA